MMRARILFGGASLACVLALAGCNPGSEPTADKGVARPDNGVGRLVSPVREFRCRPDAVTTMKAVAKVQGGGNEVVAIKPSGGCEFHLVFVDANGAEQVLSSQASGYLIAAGSRSGERVVVCASRIAHSRDLQASGSNAYLIDSVKIECAAREGKASWSPLVTVVDAPPSEWAAWVLGVSPVAGSASFEVGYIRDFSFQFLNLSNLGRPATDGIYKTRFVLESSQARLELTSRVSEVVPPKLVRQEPWDPTTEQKQRFGKYMSFEEGSCPAPAGCSK